MTNPVSNVEIEDVLSSIRKLVADEKRAAPAVPKPAPDKLVLTPAQRVKVPESGNAPGQSGRDPVLLTDPLTPAEPVADPSLEDIPRDARLSEFGAVDGLFPDIDEVETGDAADAETGRGDEAGDDAARLDLGRMIEEEVAAALAGTDAVSHSEAERDEGDDLWPEDGDAAWDDPEEEETGLVDTGALALDEDDTASTDDRELSATVAKVPPMTLEDKVAALGRLVARGKNDFEEERDTVQDDDIAAVVEPMTWPDPAPFDEMVEPEPEAGSNVVRSEGIWPAANAPEEALPDSETPSDASETADPSFPVDKDMLRDMVVEIVRTELQGALGERITRNVRKLVRREIHRILISQEFD